MIEVLIFAPLIVAVWLLGLAIIFFILSAMWAWFRG